MRVFYANSFTITNSDENLCITFEFHTEGRADSLSVVLSPQGAKTLAEGLAKHIAEFEAEQGKIKTWNQRETPPEKRPSKNNYVS